MSDKTNDGAAPADGECLHCAIADLIGPRILSGEITRDEAIAALACCLGDLMVLVPADQRLEVLLSFGRLTKQRESIVRDRRGDGPFMAANQVHRGEGR